MSIKKKIIKKKQTTTTTTNRKEVRGKGLSVPTDVFQVTCWFLALCNTYKDHRASLAYKPVVKNAVHRSQTKLCQRLMTIVLPIKNQ